MKVISFLDSQEGVEWKEWRRNGIGASDISVLMRSSPYKTPLTLWEEKCGFKDELVENLAVNHGKREEPIARRWIEENEGLSFNNICVEDDENPFFRASLDGYNKEKKILTEIKSPISPRIIENARENLDAPLHWLHQVQWQIMICKPTRAFLSIWDSQKGECIKIEVFAQPELQKEMREKGEEFWRQVQTGNAPQPSPKDYKIIEDDALKALLDEYAKHGDILKDVQRRKEELKAQIIEFGCAEGISFKCGDYKVTRSSLRTFYDMEAMKKDGVKIDKYIKKQGDAIHYRISSPKK